MLPWGHIGVGYLCYALAIRLRYRRPPTGPATVALAVGTQLPDLIDKPLGRMLAVLPSGRSLGHSLLFAVLLGAVVWYVARRRHRMAQAVALLVGHVTHVIADATSTAMAGDLHRLGFLLWPVTPAPPRTEREIADQLLIAQFTTARIVGLGLFAAAILLWVSDGKPGLESVRARLP